MNELTPGTILDPRTTDLEHEPAPDDQVVFGEPSTAVLEITENSGVWEMTPGAMRDVESDELFMVLSGHAVLEFVNPPQPALMLHAGVIVRLVDGMRTEWTVTETLRKVYWTP